MSFESEITSRVAKLENMVAAMRPNGSAYAGKNGIRITGSSGNMVIDGSELMDSVSSIKKSVSESASLAKLESEIAAINSRLSSAKISASCDASGTITVTLTI